ncbi:S phase cyclin A-associated protein in the endoplasmic reticulum [Mytilus coruscus]|uniref:S phase cyclin A-associated protein in the endoplasmic reticulum n=1 Tax=Mytilus coruscus TaxID=42192 RepID=A0A6J8EHT1_MYTCO|nr:S phase cyclin A-associated protein in the endoplasmic reticulum [Mytilus coruscus]
MSDTRKKRYSTGIRMRSDNGENYHRNSSAQSVAYNKTGRNNNSQNSTSNYHRMNSYDRVRKIVQEEGRTARNLVIYNVPVEQRRSSSGQRYHGRQRKLSQKDNQQQRPQVKHRPSSLEDQSSYKQDLTRSPRSDGGTRKTDRRARYWKFLFDNLQRAVDAMYETCEQDESVVECKEVIMMLEQSTNDFKSLIDRMHLMKAYDDATREGDRPAPIAWEVRKMSPGKTPHSQVPSRNSPSPAQRVLEFNEPNKSPGNSWADRVKGIVPQSPLSPNEVTPNFSETQESPVLTLPSPPLHQNGLSASEADTDGSNTIEDDGWETVQRGGKSRSRNSLENLSTVGRPAKAITRTLSDPHAPLIKKNKGHFNTMKKSLSDGNQTVPNKSARHDSEKENEPVKGRNEMLDASTKNSSPVVNNTSRSYSGTVKGTNTQSKQAVISNAKTVKDSKTIKERPQSLTESKVIAKTTRNISSPRGENGRNLSSPRGDTSRNVSSPRGELKTMPTIATKPPSGSKMEKSRASPQTTLKKSEIDPVKIKTKEFRTRNFSESKDDTEEDISQIEDALASVIDEENDLTDELVKAQEQALENVIQEEESWLKELAKEENTVIDVETETESELGNTMSSSLDNSQQTLDWDAMVALYEEEKASGVHKSWGDIVEDDEDEVRTPGHAVHMHEKLSSPSRKRSPTESKKRHEEKQAKAQEQREKLMQEKAERLKELSKKVEEVRALKDDLMNQKKETILRKMQKAEEKREIQLKLKAQKAHEEEAKANEIAFINTLEAQNKRHEIMSKHQVSEARLQDIQEERQRKHEEKLAKEAAVEERRKALEAEKQARLKEMEAKRKQRENRFTAQQLEKEKERFDALRAKEKERDERLAVLNAQHEAHIQELQKKIQQKQDESTQRHQEALQQIREKAFEMSVLRHSTEDHNDAPTSTPYEKKKLCTICNALIISEVYLLSHLRGKKHQQALKDNNSGRSMCKEEIEKFNLKHIVDAPSNSTHPKIVSEKERLKSMKKRCKKLRQRMTTRGLEYESSLSGKQQPVESEHKAKLHKVIRDITKYLQNTEKGPWSQSRVSALDRALGEISRILDKKTQSATRKGIILLEGIKTYSKFLIILLVITIVKYNDKSIILTCTVFRQACKGCYDNCHYMMFSNKVGNILELLSQRLLVMMPNDQNLSSMSSSSSQPASLPYDSVAVSTLQLVSTVLSCLAKHNPSINSSEASMERMSGTGDAFMSRGNDMISYMISVGIVDKLTQYFRSVQGPLHDDKDAAEFLQHGLGLLVAVTKFMSKRNNAIFEKKKQEDPTTLINTFEVTELVGIVSLLYGMLLHSGTPSRSDTPPPELPPATLQITITGLKMLNYMAVLNLDMLQKTLGEEGSSLEFRHIASYSMWYCVHHQCEELLHEVIVCVGYFTVLNPDNQVVIQSGQSPTILQQMCSLPFHYFSDPRLTTILFPTLIACCYNNQSNREILEQELSCVLLSNFIEEKQLENQQTSLFTKKEKEKAKEGDQKNGAR